MIHHVQMFVPSSDYYCLKYRGKMIPSELYKEIESAKSKVRIYIIIDGEN